MSQVGEPPDQTEQVPTMAVAMNDSSNTLPPTRPPSIISATSEETTPDDGGLPFTQVKKRRRRSGGSCASDSTIISRCSPNGLTLVIKPKDPNSKLSKLNALKLSEMLDSVAPDGVTEIRPNHRLNLLALDTRNQESTKALLHLKRLCGVEVLVYEPRSRTSAVGVIRDVNDDIFDDDLKTALRATAPVTNARRLGHSQVVKIELSTPEMPEYVTLGYIRYKVHPYLERPIQCSNCFGFGHIKSVCSKSACCAYCGGQHDRNTCTSDAPRCANCGKNHQSTSRQCHLYMAAQEITAYRSKHNVNYPTAQSAVASTLTRGPPHIPKQAVPTAQQPSASHLEDCSQFPELPATTPVSPPTRREPEPNVVKRHTTSSRTESVKPQSCSRSPKSGIPTVDNISASPSTHGIWHMISLVMQVLRRILSPLTSPVAQFILRVLDFVEPFVL